MIVTENAAWETRKKHDRETESIRPFHEGPLERCPRCGRKVFQPCLACAMELDGKVHDPLDEPKEEPEILRIQLRNDERQRYEYVRLEKFAEAIRREDREKKTRLHERTPDSDFHVD